MNACARIENGLVEEPEEPAGEASEQQSVGGSPIFMHNQKNQHEMRKNHFVHSSLIHLIN